ncbi:MAG TPA: ABC transporter ATP-binding protein [Pseudomonadales bacterium]
MPTATEQTTPPLLQLDGVRVDLDGRSVLNDVSMSVAGGEVVVLLGPNGAGKTTLLSLACGRRAPDAGRVRLAGHDPRTESSVRRQLGFVPQHVALYQHLSVVENLSVLGRMMGVARGDLAGRVAEALDWSGLADRARDRVGTLSGGMRRRLNIVASLLHEPALLLLDEPTVGVDVAARERVHELLRRQRSQGLGILLTTHDLPQATELADRVVMLVDGSVRLSGVPGKLIQDTFADKRELTVTLAQPATDPQSRTLRDAGLTPGRGGLTWYGAADNEHADARRWDDRLQEMALAIAEIRVRAPTLEGVYLRLTGEELDL